MDMYLLNKQKHLACFLISLIFLLIGIITKNNDLGFYFTGTFDEHKRWFPNFYIISYCFFKLYFPLFLGITAFYILEFLLKKKETVLHIGKILINIIPVIFLFVIYITLSWILPEYYPFSKYPMYSSWANEDPVFSLKDSNNTVIPLNKVTGIDGAELSHVYWTLWESGIQDSSIGQKMMVFLKRNRYDFSQVKGVINLSQTTLFIENGKIQTHEIQLYTDTLE